MSILERGKEDLFLLADALMAFRRGDEGPEAYAGALLIAQALVRLGIGL